MDGTEHFEINYLTPLRFKGLNLAEWPRFPPTDI